MSLIGLKQDWQSKRERGLTEQMRKENLENGRKTQLKPLLIDCDKVGRAKYGLL